MKNAGIYVRVSTEKQAAVGYSISAQKENLTRFAKNNNFKIYKVYADEGISGKNIDGRVAVKELIEDIKNHKIDVILIQKFDRLTRNISDTEEFIKLFQKYDVDVWSITDGRVDISDSNGKFMTLLKGLFAQHERELTSERIKIALNEKARQGYTLCCACTPYGYKRQKGNKIILINKEEEKVVQKIFKMYLEGMTLTKIAKTLNEESVPTKNAGKIKKNNKIIISTWMPKTIKLILTNPVYIGKVRYGIGRKDYYIGEGQHKPIINLKVWNEVQEKIQKSKKKVHTNRPKEDAYFCGTLVCGLCGNKFTTARTIGKIRKDGTRNVYCSYRCINKEKKICNNKSISHKKLEKEFMVYLENYIEHLNIVEDIKIKQQSSKEEIENIKTIIYRKKKKQKEIMNLFLSEKIDNIQLKYMNNELNNIIKYNEEKLKKICCRKSMEKQKNMISKSIANHWKYLTNKEKYEFLNEFVEKIVIVNDEKKYDTETKKLTVIFYS